MSRAANIVDSHLHVWRAAAGPTPGLQTIVPPQTDVPIDLAAETMDEHGIARAVLVQPVFPGENNTYVAECARSAPERFAAVCVVDPRRAGAEDRLEHWVRQGCRGLRLRPRIGGEQEVFGDPSTYSLWQAAERLGAVVSLLAGVEHASQIGNLAERFPRVPIVIDHLGHPDPREGAAGKGFRALLSLARHTNVHVKLSGFYHFSRERFPFADCAELVRAAYEHFGGQRLLWGSDFPHVLLACGYARSRRVVEEALERVSVADRQRVMGGNAERLYWQEI
jgi:predicted TIM-barrel fold metal-dependent hydrolase